MFSLRIQKSIQKPSKFGFKNPWKFEHHLCQLKVNMLHFWSQKAIKMRSKILENQVRSGQLSSGHVFGQQATSPPPVWKGRGTQRHSRMCPPPKRSFVTFDRGGQTGPPRSNDFFSAPLTTQAPLTTWKFARASLLLNFQRRNNIETATYYNDNRRLSAWWSSLVITVRYDGDPRLSWQVDLLIRIVRVPCDEGGNMFPPSSQGTRTIRINRSTCHDNRGSPS